MPSTVLKIVDYTSKKVLCQETNQSKRSLQILPRRVVTYPELFQRLIGVCQKHLVDMELEISIIGQF